MVDAPTVEVTTVRIGKVCLGRAPNILKAVLGTCVGIAFVWRERDLCGLAHCLLPRPGEGHEPGAGQGVGAKYVSQAVPSLIRLMKILPENISAVRVEIAGGGLVLGPLGREGMHIGSENVRAAREILNESGFEIHGDQTGGSASRKMQIDCQTGDVTVNELAKEEP